MKSFGNRILDSEQKRICKRNNTGKEGNKRKKLNNSGMDMLIVCKILE